MWEVWQYAARHSLSEHSSVSEGVHCSYICNQVVTTVLALGAYW